MSGKVTKPRTSTEHIEIEWVVDPQHRVWEHGTYTERFRSSGDDDPVTHLRVKRIEKRYPQNKRGVMWSQCSSTVTLTFSIELDEVSALQYVMTDWVAFLLRERSKRKEEASA